MLRLSVFEESNLDGLVSFWMPASQPGASEPKSQELGPTLTYQESCWWVTITGLGATGNHWTLTTDLTKFTGSAESALQLSRVMWI